MNMSEWGLWAAKKCGCRSTYVLLRLNLLMAKLLQVVYVGSYVDEFIGR